MTSEELWLRRGVVLGSAVVYWAGVVIQARRVRRRIGRAPNLRPRSTKEKLLWVGWTVVIGLWLLLPCLASLGATSVFWRLPAWALSRAGLVLGLGLIVIGYAGTLWCYVILGDAWRIGIDRKEKNALVTSGPYARVRHPIYLFQLLMLVGAAALLPTWLSVLAVAIHWPCVLVKAQDEEGYLVGLHGQAYRDYQSRTGGLFPRRRPPETVRGKP